MSTLHPSLENMSAEEKRALLTRLLTEKSRKSRSFPLSFAQQRLWFFEQLMPETPVYHVTMALQLRGPLQVDLLRRSLTAIVHRHDALRTIFTVEDGQPSQRITPPAQVALPIVDLRHLPRAERELNARELARAEQMQLFDFQHGPLFRFKVLQLDAVEHVVLLSIHHIIFDNWSMGIFLREMITFYTALQSDPGVDPLALLPVLPIQYTDFSVWQREQLTPGASAGLLERQLAYWQQQLADAPRLLTLPTDRPRPVMQTTAGATHAFSLSVGLTAALKALSRQEGVTLFMTLLAGFQILLSRYSGQSHVIVGTPVAGRTGTNLEGLIGLFINMLPLHTDLSGDPSGRELLARVRAVCLGAYAHQELPFEKLVEALRIERKRSHTTLFQVVFDLHNTPTDSATLPGVEMSWWAEEVSTAKFDLSLAMKEGGDQLHATIEYNTDLFDAITIERLAQHFTTLLDSLVAAPNRPISRLDLLTPAERHDLLIARNATDAPYPAHRAVHHLIAEQVQRSPEAIAVQFGSTSLSYHQLDTRANQLAHLLRAHGVTLGTSVALCLDRSLDLVVALLAIFKAGAAFVPLDPDFPADRMAYILADAQVALVLTHDALRPCLPVTSVPVLVLDSAASAIAAQPVTPPPDCTTGAHLAYLIYTSGSTGRPKGVLIPHRGLLNYLVWCADAYTAAAGRGAPVHASIAADAIFPSLFAPLLVGTTVVLLPPDEPLPALAADLTERGNYSLIKITPSQLEVLGQHHHAHSAAGWTHTLVVGAEEVRGEILHFWQQTAPETIILNEYGPTETVVGCSSYPVPPIPSVGSVPFGRPIANLQFYVLDRHLQPVPVGVPGELYIGGDGVAWGYHNRPDLTAEKFVPDPFTDPAGARVGARLYKTGDLVRSLPDAEANLVFLERIDDQVKIRGYRVEPGEVAAVVRQHPQVLQAEVLARQDGETHARRLVAYVVAADSGLTASALRTFVQQQLPEYMVPSAVIFLPEIPLAPHGKINRAALPAPTREQVEDAAAFVAPRDELEQQIAEIWQGVLGIPEIGITDNFFALGGHSLSAVRLIARLQHEFQRPMPLSTLIEGTIEQMATLLRQQNDATLWPTLVPIQSSGTRRPFFCVHAVGGDVLAYHALARRLGPDQPFYGLQAPPLHEVSDRELRIEDMASRYIQALRTLQPSGPYQLGGWSFGGVVAFEMAQQLHRQGEQVALLALLDTRTPQMSGTPENLSDAMVLAGVAREHALQVGKELTVSIDELQHMEPDAQLRYVLDEIKRIGLEFETELSWIQRFVGGMRARGHALHLYQPQLYPGRITLFQTPEEDPEILKVGLMMGRDFTSPAQGWSKFSGEPIVIYNMPGYHGMMVFEPYVAILAAQLSQCLEAGSGPR